MCKLKSAIILKNKIFMPDYDSHSAMLEELKIKDDYLGASKTFVRAELSPKNGDVFSDIDTKLGMRGIKLPANVDAVHKVLNRQKVKCDREQAERVAWRILKDWVEAQMAILESQMVQMDEIFLPYMIAKEGLTTYELYKNNQLLLGGPSENEY